MLFEEWMEENKERAMDLILKGELIQFVEEAWNEGYSEGECHGLRRY